MGTHVLRDTISAPKVVSREFTCLILLTRGKTPPFLLDITFVFSFESFNLDSKMQFPIEKPLGGKDLTIGSVLCVPGGMGVVEIERFYLK